MKTYIPLGLGILFGLWLSACVTMPQIKAASQGDLNKITALAKDSACAKVTWKNRGKAPIGYTKGMGFAFAKSYCKKRFEFEFAESNDAVMQYQIPRTPVHTYALLHGLGMRESSGQYCEGRDMSATNTKSETAEAGPFQTSWNAAGSHVSLKKIKSEYEKGGKCFLDVWQEGVSPAHCSRQSSYFGSGDGLAFQKLARNCPAFAAEFAAVTIRSLRKHYGPLVRREAEVRQECVDMYTKIKAAVDANPALCATLE